MKSRLSAIGGAAAGAAIVLSMATPSTAERAPSSASGAQTVTSIPVPHLGRGVAPKRHPDVPPTMCASPQLVWGGGQVVSNAEVVQVNWGSSVSAATISLFEGWYPAMIAGPYFTWLKEYNANGQTIGGGTYKKNPASTGSWTITPVNTATTVSETDIGNEIIGQIKAGHLPQPTKDSLGNSNTVYMIDFPNGMVETLEGNDSCVAFCGYHEEATDPTLGKVYYGVHPDMSAGSGCEPQQGQWVCGGSLDPLVAAATTHGHELTETITDPENNSAWLDQNNGCGEIGDICANELGSCGDATCLSASVGSLSIGGTTYYAQTEWSNAQADCVMHGPAVTCTTNADCTATPGTPICDITSKVCRACASADCSGATPACESIGTFAGQCVQCTSTALTACTAGTPICDSSTDKCRACTATDCTAPKAVCESAGTKLGSCVQCDASHKTACTGSTLVCDATTFTCEGCATNADCMAPSPICDSTSKTCRGCKGNTDCTSGQVCATTGSKAGTCVGCSTNSDCTMPNDPVCSAATGTCGPCKSSADCTGGTCNTTTGACSSTAGGDGGAGADGGSGSSSGGSSGGGGEDGGNGGSGSGSSGGCAVATSTHDSSMLGLGGLVFGLSLLARRRSTRR